ncbi:HAD family hydrolase [Ensifer soli]|uniref:HAD family hydrolase n=1 Tax=Ciceribacter sp. sgz301302 TaxID=3342379 RepID=UPI0035BB8677
MTRPTILFDLDGTLVDTATDLIASLNHAVGQAGMEPVTYDDLTHLVGHGARAMIERTFRLRDRPLDDETLAWQLKEFLDFYEGSMPGLSLPYPGVIQAIERLGRDGMVFAVCTNKTERLARTLVDTLGLGHLFAAIAGGDTFPVRKPDPGHILGTIAMAGGSPQHAVMIGDSRSDILGARHAGIPSIGVPFGYSDVPVADLEPDALIEHFDQLDAALVLRLMSARNAPAR